MYFIFYYVLQKYKIMNYTHVFQSKINMDLEVKNTFLRRNRNLCDLWNLYKFLYNILIEIMQYFDIMHNTKLIVCYFT